ncbi:type II toxin-antitoxin system RelE/ParE family toxin [Aquiflexum sp.]|uniref:type II toxin-antitoxin system RelE/ParE family toxin n=1 Tax=Aquiflexum sp. TaxID=1872584 RepID=UPI0035937F5A
MGNSKIEITESAWEDLTEIDNNISKYSPKIARSLIIKFFNKFDLIATFPEMGRIVPEFGSPMIREIFQSKYRIIYYHKNQKVEILRIIHGSKLIDTK